MGGVCWGLSSLNSLASSHSSWMDVTRGFHRCVLGTKDTANDEVLVAICIAKLAWRGLSLTSSLCKMSLQWWLT
jgi:hypothetical protein